MVYLKICLFSRVISLQTLKMLHLALSSLARLSLSAVGAGQVVCG